MYFNDNPQTTSALVFFPILLPPVFLASYTSVKYGVGFRMIWRELCLLDKRFDDYPSTNSAKFVFDNDFSSVKKFSMEIIVALYEC